MKTVISVKVDKDVRDRAQKTARKLGVPLSLVVNTSLKRFASEERLVVAPASRLDPELLADIHAAIADMHAGRLTPAFSSGKELRAYMRAKKKRA